MENPNKKKQLNKYLQLTSIAFQMGITIYLGAYFGKKLDAYYMTEKKYQIFDMRVKTITGNIIIGTRGLVVSSIPDNAVAHGVPAKVVRK